MRATTNSSPHPRKAGSALEVLMAFLKLGVTCFGGPVAHIGYFRREFVELRGWLDEETFIDLVALCQFLPGPASSQVGFSIGLLRAGWLGGIAAWCAFTLPSAMLLACFAAIAPGINGTASDGLIHGLKLVAVAVVAQAVWDMARRLCTNNQRAAIALIAIALLGIMTTVYAQLVVIMVGALLGLGLCRSNALLNQIGTRQHAQQFHISRMAGNVALALFFILLFGLPVLGKLYDSQAIHIFEAFYRSGALVFGGGHVVLPLLQQQTVATGWITASDFLAGYGAAQSIPGPLFTFAAFLGWMTGMPNHWSGAILATVGIFLPGLLLILGALPYWQMLRSHPSMAAALAGINAAVVGLLASALYTPVWISAVHSGMDFAIVSIGFLLLIRWKIPPLVIVIFCALAGIVETMTH